MQSLIEGRAVIRGVFIALLLYVVCEPGARLHASAGDAKVIELTQVDLFSFVGWQRQSVALNGFVVGMTRTQATELALERDLRFVPTGKLEGPCRQGPCDIYKVRGPWIGVALFFDATDKVDKIKVSVPVDAAPEVKRANVARQFKGLTCQLFNHYSDALRQKIFGPAEGKENPQMPPGSALVDEEYDYLHSGIIVHTTIDKRDHPPKPFDLEIDFVAAQPN
jgi:hypothetical protein